jgi:hypothetical protein
VVVALAQAATMTSANARALTLLHSRVRKVNDWEAVFMTLNSQRAARVGQRIRRFFKNKVRRSEPASHMRMSLSRSARPASKHRQERNEIGVVWEEAVVIEVDGVAAGREATGAVAVIETFCVVLGRPGEVAKVRHRHACGLGDCRRGWQDEDREQD